MSKKKNDQPPSPADDPSTAVDDELAAEPAPEAPPDPAPDEPSPDDVVKFPLLLAEPEPVRYFRVERYAAYCREGAVSYLHAGVVITNLTHDLDDVRAQGVPLVEVSRDDVPQVQPRAR